MLRLRKIARRSEMERAFTRIGIKGRVYIHDDLRLFIAPIRNISEGGLFIHGLTTLQVGKTVRLVIKSTELSQTIQAKGTVVRIENQSRQGSAIQFQDLPSSSRNAIQRCVALTYNSGVQAIHA